jgi:CHU_C Type IX secretion signal domain
VLFSLNGAPYSSDHSFDDLAPGNYAVTLLDNNGCEWSTDTLTVFEPVLFTVDLGPEITATLGDSIFLNATSTVPLAVLSSLRWSPLFDTLHANTFMHSNGCKANTTVLFLIERPRQVYIPNVFKLGGTNFNDRVVVYGGRGVEIVESFRIFDRWGEQLFEGLNFQPNDTNLGWDGTQRGESVMPGVYVYLAVVRFINGEVEVFKGDVTVVR